MPFVSSAVVLAVTHNPPLALVTSQALTVAPLAEELVGVAQDVRNMQLSNLDVTFDSELLVPSNELCVVKPIWEFMDDAIEPETRAAYLSQANLALMWEIERHTSDTALYDSPTQDDTERKRRKIERDKIREEAKAKAQMRLMTATDQIRKNASIDPALATLQTVFGVEEYAKNLVGAAQ